MEVGFRKVAILPELTLAYLSVLTSEIIMLASGFYRYMYMYIVSTVPIDTILCNIVVQFNEN
jgi:hypothetical protein